MQDIELHLFSFRLSWISLLWICCLGWGLNCRSFPWWGFCCGFLMTGLVSSRLRIDTNSINTRDMKTFSKLLLFLFIVIQQWTQKHLHFHQHRLHCCFIWSVSHQKESCQDVPDHFHSPHSIVQYMAQTTPPAAVPKNGKTDICDNFLIFFLLSLWGRIAVVVTLFSPGPNISKFCQWFVFAESFSCCWFLCKQLFQIAPQTKPHTKYKRHWGHHNSDIRCRLCLNWTHHSSGSLLTHPTSGGKAPLKVL